MVLPSPRRERAIQSPWEPSTVDYSRLREPTSRLVVFFTWGWAASSPRAITTLSTAQPWVPWAGLSVSAGRSPRPSSSTNRTFRSDSPRSSNNNSFVFNEGISPLFSTHGVSPLFSTSKSYLFPTLGWYNSGSDSKMKHVRKEKGDTYEKHTSVFDACCSDDFPDLRSGAGGGRF